MFTLNDAKLAFNKTTGTAAGATAATLINNAGKMNKAVDTTFAVAGKTVGAVKGVMPATNKRVDDIAAKFNNRLNNLEMQQRVVDVKLSMISQATGVQFPTDEEIVEALVEEDEAEKATTATQVIADAVNNPDMMNMFGMIAEKLFGMNPFAPAQVDDITEVEIPVLEPKLKEVSTEIVDEAEVPEPVKAKAKVKKEQPKKEQPKKEEVVVEAKGLTGPMKSGRKKLGRQAPLAE